MAAINFAQPRVRSVYGSAAFNGSAFAGTAMTDFASATHAVRSRLAALGEAGRRRFRPLRAVPPLPRLLEMAARVGYGARGLVYVSIGIVTLMAALDLVGDAVGSRGAVAILAEQPFGRFWLIAIGVGLWAFVLWRVLQSVFDADREGTEPKALAMRAGQAVSGIFYGVLASAVFELLDEFPTDPASDDVAENQEKAAALLTLPFGDWLLLGVGLVILGVGIGNILKGAWSDFGEALSCSPKVCRRLSLIARAGYVARGVAYLPLGVFVVLAGLRASAAEVTGFGAALDALERQPGGSLVLGLTACGLIAFGLFAFVEARFRRIRAPADLKPG